VRFVRYAAESGSQSGPMHAVVLGDELLPLPGTILETLADPAALGAVRQAINARPTDLVPRDSVRILPPTSPTKIVCVGYNYRGHVRDGQDPNGPDPEYPDFFVKTPNVLIGQDDDVELPLVDADVDYEGEIALIIGRRAKNVPLETALDAVAGYAVFNDVTARDWQRRTSQFTLGKSFDTFGPIGGELVTADEVGDPEDLLVEVVREGVVTAWQSTQQMIFPMAYLVHYLSQVMTLEPGDIISTGAPQKLPEAQAAHRPLAHGDSVTVRVSRIGELTTRFVDPLVR
jgi:2-keto-4-pentenoate hydratase/2-oxohepta-3-ene-1,7-dioic acid hydratase in catechol pathway